MQKTIKTKYAKIISQKLIEIRKMAGLTQRALAQKLEREHSFVAHYELCERRIDLAEFYQICKACEVSPHQEIKSLIEIFDNV